MNLKMSIFLSPMLKLWCLFKDKCHLLMKHPGEVLNSVVIVPSCVIGHSAGVVR